MGVHSRMSSTPLSPTTPKSAPGTFVDINGAASNNNNSGKPPGSPSFNPGNNSNNNNSNNAGIGNGNSNNNNNNTNGNGNLNSSSAYASSRKSSWWTFGYGMRSQLHYEDRLFYIMAVILDFLLRTTWMLKLVSNIQIEEYEGGVFTMECLEVLRRWIWVLFRLESELVKRTAGPHSSQSSPSLNPASVGLLMNESDMDGHNSDIMMEDLESWQK